MNEFPRIVVPLDKQLAILNGKLDTLIYSQPKDFGVYEMVTYDGMSVGIVKISEMQAKKTRSGRVIFIHYIDYQD
jgi:hypothetical protein